MGNSVLRQTQSLVCLLNFVIQVISPPSEHFMVGFINLSVLRLLKTALKDDGSLRGQRVYTMPMFPALGAVNVELGSKLTPVDHPVFPELGSC